MNKSDLVEVISQDIDYVNKQGVKDVVGAVFDHIGSELRNGGEVNIPGFGKFHPVRRAAKTGRNPATGGTLSIPERTVPKFTPSKTLKDALAS